MNLLSDWDGIISLFIACIEILLLVNLFIFSEKNRTNIIIYFIIAFLTGYQVFEFLLCGADINSSYAAYLAFVDISFLPPLNLLLILSVIKSRSKINYLIFIPAVFFVVYYLFFIDQFKVVKCTVLYAVYNYPSGDLFGFFYYLPILISFIILLKKRKEIARKQTAILFIAHLFIIVPVSTGFILLYLNVPG
ncbi:MAG: hypothetical protein EHM47_16070, partial [Ignavibacteriales bacterium]